jgi:heat shock protein HslJ
MLKRMPLTPVVVGLVVLLAVVVGACDTAGSSPGDTPEPTTSTGLDSTDWVISTIGGRALLETPVAGLTFQPGGRVNGSTGCNSFMGTASIDGAALAFGPLATTKRGCEPPLMDQEQLVLDALAGVSGWAVDGDGRLHLTGSTELVLAPATR